MVSPDPIEIDRIVEGIGRGPDAVIPILRAIQNRYNYLPEAALRRVCEVTEISPASIVSVATFYPQFRYTPAGRHSIKVCIGTACHVKGAELVYNAFRRYLEISDQEDTDRHRLFTVEKVACLGCCMLAPAVQIDDIAYGYLTSQKVPSVLKDFLESEQGRIAKKDRAIAGAKTGIASGQIRICLCSSCKAAGAESVYEEMKEEILRSSVPAVMKVVGCSGISYEAPLVEIVLSDGRSFRYGKIRSIDVKPILLRHFPPTRLMTRVSLAASGLLETILMNEAGMAVTRYMVDIRDRQGSAYWRRQKRIATEHSGSMDPLDMDEYIFNGGFMALDECTSSHKSPKYIIEQIRRSGLRGRGGAGFSTAQKWVTVSNARSTSKYIVCNGDEGDPGAFMDRMILESFPFRIIEGMAIAAYAVGASSGFIYIRAEYPLAFHRMKEALKICEKRNSIGSLQLKIVEGAGAFVCGEETALIAALEGRRAMPRYRPPYPSENGLWGHPTLINNVETFAMIPWIIRHGAETFASLGTKSSPGTKTFALAGKIVRGGLIEVPMGITLIDIVENIGGGIQGGKRLKAIQVGGPSGGCVPAHLAHLPVDYDSLASAGALMGSGGLVVLDETDCMVDIARYFLAFTQRESCGKCTYCRIGTKIMLDILERLCQGKGKRRDIEELEHLAKSIQRGSLCGLGKTAPNPVLSTMRHFRHEYEAHIEGCCPAKKCKELITYTINDKCIGCTRCAQRCPVGAIAMHPYQKHEIDQEKCIRCDTCRQACFEDAIDIK